jgi:mono/diheme cytochrome c family protein
MRARVGSLALAAAFLCGCRQQQAETRPDSGQMIYMARCAVCHGENGEGRPGMYPPLTGSQWVNGPPERLAALILDGLQGPVGNYNSVMPGWRGYLHDAEIAAVMTWLRKAPVTAVEVNHVRLETDARNSFWTANDLQSLRIH